MRVPHYWRKTGRTTAPSSFLFIDTETRQGPEGRLLWRMGYALAFRREAGRRRSVASRYCERPEQMREMLESRLDRDRPLWVMGHNLAFDLQIAGLWGVICSERFACSYAVVSPAAFVIKGKLDGKKVIFCDSFNYFKCPLRDMGKDLGLPKLAMPDDGAPAREWEDYCRRDVEIVAAAIESLAGFMAKENLGPWATTVAGLSFSAYRHRFMPANVLVHVDKRALRLERASYYGGAVDTAFVGEVRNLPVYELDVHAMYPAASRIELPYRHAGYSDRIGVDALESLASQYSVTAEVFISTDSVTYPMRWGGKVYHPWGSYWTTLADPELRQALRCGHVVRVKRASWYHRLPIFADYMDYLLRLRRELTDGKQPAWAQMAKAMANSLYGKCGQRGIRWEEWGEEALRRIEDNHGLEPGALARRYHKPPRLKRMEERYIMAAHGITLSLRNYWGVVEVQTDWGESRDSCPAIAAAITSEARLRLREYQKIAGPKHWFYSDTDSIWVDKDGLKNLATAGCVAEGVPGFLSIRGEYGRFVVHAPKDYETDRSCKIKGMRADAAWTDPRTYWQDVFPGPGAILRDVHNPGVVVTRIKRELRRELDKVRVGADGWTQPLLFPEMRPTEQKRRIDT